ncbi:branched-chain amino acid transporter permease [Flaviflexus sp.]|uniref:branched-chain amino acid transporter permease n=1 Tax=Flaviflexus sp. TaxID=1969482 RepID=UPI003F9013A1
MPELSYLIAVLAIGFVIDFALRGVPFLVLEPLRESDFVGRMAGWMPAGILAILAIATVQSAAEGGGSRLAYALIASAVTVTVHLGFGRRTLLSVSAGTGVFVLLVNLA